MKRAKKQQPNIMWQTMLKAAAENPKVTARFTYFYQRLAGLPRRWRRRIQRTVATGLVGAALLLAWSPTPIVQAAPISVASSAAGINAGDGCSLVEAIINANNDDQTGSAECVAGSGDDTIYLSGRVFSYTYAYGTNSALPDIQSNITINANNAIIKRDSSAGADFRILRVTTTGNLTLNNATISGGRVYGGILNEGFLTINNSEIIDNQNSTTSGGGIFNRSQTLPAILTVNNSAIVGNRVSGNTRMGAGIASEAAGLFNASTIISNSTIAQNTATGSKGAGFGNRSSGGGNVDTVIIQSTITGNEGLAFGLSFSSGGGIFNQGANATIELKQSIVSGNTAFNGIAEILNTGGSVTGGSYNLLGNNRYDAATAFDGFTPSGNDINGTSDGANIALTAIMERGTRDWGTHANRLVAGSPAIDAIPTDAPADPPCDPASSTAPSDQFGNPRAGGAGAGGAGCDIGAFEYDNTLPGNTITVVPGAAGVQGGDGCSLVEAVVNANNDNETHIECTNGAGADTIVLAGNTYSYTSDYNGNVAALPLINSAITIEGNGATIQRTGGGAFSIIRVRPYGDLTLNETTISGGDASVGGGLEIYYGAATLNNSVITGNASTVVGGGIMVSGQTHNDIGSPWVDDASPPFFCIPDGATPAPPFFDTDFGTEAQLTVNQSTISNNTTGKAGAGILAEGANIVVRASTISGNTVQGATVVRYGGGGVGLKGSYAYLINSTLSNNHSIGNGGGIGPYVDTNGTNPAWNRVILDSVTLTGNTSGRDIGNAIAGGLATIEIKNSLISGNGTGYEWAILPYDTGIPNPISYSLYCETAVQATISNVIVGDITKTNAQATIAFNFSHPFGHLLRTNVIRATSNGDTPTALSSILNTTLADNGGPTLTHALVSGSPAIDVIADGVDSCGTTVTADQRGILRPQEGACDAGAVELFTPAAIADLDIAISGADVTLTWSEVGSTLEIIEYQVYRSTEPYFQPVSGSTGNLIGSSATGSFPDAGALTGGQAQYYLVVAVGRDGISSAISNRVGAFPFALIPGS